MKNKLEKLLTELEITYEQSDNKKNKFCNDNGRKWGYELIQSALVEKKPLIIGFNWGVDNRWKKYLCGIQYTHQKEISKQNFLEIFKGSLGKALSMCKLYFPDIDFKNGSHSNFCFFRSEKENQISKKDISLCIPIFRKMIEIVNPSVVFCFSSKARNYLLNNQLIQNINVKKITTTNKNGRKNTFKAVKGYLDNGSPIYCLPYPNARLKRDVRNQAWEFCSNGLTS